MLILLAFLIVFAPSNGIAKTIKWSMQGDSLTLDPHAQNEGPTTQVSRQIYEALVTRGLDMSIGPQLATKWKAVDPNTWYFFLREDVKFSNGQPMTSEDVVFSILRAKQPTSDFKEYISTISSVKAIDKYTVQIKTSKPNPILLNQLSNIFVIDSNGDFSDLPDSFAGVADSVEGVVGVVGSSAGGGGGGGGGDCSVVGVFTGSTDLISSCAPPIILFDNKLIIF